MISKASRYTDTTLLDAGSGITYWSSWVRIKELIDASTSFNYKEHVVTSVEVGCLDIIAQYYYNNERLWWIIAAFNNLIDPVQDMYVGQKLKIPSSQYIMLFTART